MNEQERQVLSDIEATVSQLKNLQDLAYTKYAQAVDAILDGQIVSETAVEHILNGIIDLGDDIRFLDLTKKLRRHILDRYPRLVGNYKNMFLLLCGGNEDDGDL